MNRLLLALSLLLLPNTPTPAVFAGFVFGEDEGEDEEDDGDGNGDDNDEDIDDDDDDEDEDDNADDEDEDRTEDGDEDEDRDEDDDEDEDRNEDGDEDEDRDEDDEDDGDALSRSNPGTPQDREVEQTDPSIELVTKLCFGLVIFDATTNSLRFAHTSVQEYVVTRKDGYMPLSQSFARIAKRCMSILIEPESVIDSVRPYQIRPLWPKKGSHKRSSTTFPSGDYFEISPSHFTIDWISNFWAYFVAKSYEMRQTQWMKTLETRLQDSVDGTPWESINPCVFFSACQFGNTQLVQKWLSRHPRLALLKQCHGSNTRRTALHLAAHDDHPDIAACLLDAGAELNAQADPGGVSTPLDYAVSEGSLRMVRMILQSGQSDANESPKSTTEDHTLGMAMCIAASTGNEEILHILLDHGASPNARGAAGATPLGLAIDQCLQPVVRLLLGRGASLLTEAQGYLDLAVKRDRTSDGEYVRLLLDAGANPRAGGPKAHVTPFGVASGLNRKAVVQMFLDFGVGVNDPVTVDGLTALMLAVSCGNDQIIELLLAAGADPNITNVHGQGAMMLAAESGSLKAVKALLPLTTNLNTQAMDSNTALSGAAKRGHQAVVEALLEAGAEVDPDEPGPHCSFLSPSERVSGFAMDACASAIMSENVSTLRTLVISSIRPETKILNEMVLDYLDIEARDRFELENFGQKWTQALAHVGVNRLESESDFMALIESLSNTGANILNIFAVILLLMNALKKSRYQNFVKRIEEKIDAIIEERKRKIEEEWQAEKLKESKIVREPALSGNRSTTNTFND